MKDAVGHMLRETWTRKGNPHCHHPESEKEYTFSGGITGCYNCTICGEVVRREEIGSEVKREAQTLKSEGPIGFWPRS